MLDNDCLQKTGAKLYRASYALIGNVKIIDTSLTIRGKILEEITKLTNSFTFTTNKDRNVGTGTSTSPVRKIEEEKANNNLKAKVPQLERKFEYPTRIFNETTEGRCQKRLPTSRTSKLKIRISKNSQHSPPALKASKFCVIDLHILKKNR